MLSILVGTFLVSATHAILPDHWLPLILISRAEKWSQTETFWVTSLIVIPHLVSTILLGLLMGIIGFKLSVLNEALMEVVTPVIFIFLGLVYIYRNYRANGHHHGVDISNLNNKSKGRVVTIMATALFFSPCIPMGSYFLIAGADGIGILTLVAIIHVVATLGGILTMVALGRRGIEKMKWNFLKHNENLITGLILVFLGFYHIFFH